MILLSIMLLSWHASSAPLREEKKIIRFQSYNQNHLQYIFVLIDDYLNAPSKLHFGSDTDNNIIIFDNNEPFFESWAG